MDTYAAHQVEFRCPQWVRIGPQLDKRTAIEFRDTMIREASATWGPDAEQYVRSHTRVVRITTTTEREVIE